MFKEFCVCVGGGGGGGLGLKWIAYKYAIILN